MYLFFCVFYTLFYTSKWNGETLTVLLCVSFVFNGLLELEEKKQLALDEELEGKKQVLERLHIVKASKDRVEQGLKKLAPAAPTDSVPKATKKAKAKPSLTNLREIEDLSLEVDKRLTSLGLSNTAEQDYLSSEEGTSSEEEGGNTEVRNCNQRRTQRLRLRC